jgi:hypothetical protein
MRTPKMSDSQVPSAQAGKIIDEGKPVICHGYPFISNFFKQHPIPNLIANV